MLVDGSQAFCSTTRSVYRKMKARLLMYQPFPQIAIEQFDRVTLSCDFSQSIGLIAPETEFDILYEA